MYACTGASPSAFAICGLPPERRTTFSCALIGLAFAPAFDRGLGLARDLLAKAASSCTELIAIRIESTGCDYNEYKVSRIANATAVERALLILEYLDSSRRGLNISEIGRKLEIPKSSAHVIVVTLERLGYLERKPDSLNYHLGLKAYGLGRGMIKDLSLGELALPVMRVLVDRLHVPAHLAVADGEQGVYVQKVDAPGLIKFDTYIGRRMDLHCTGVGKVMLAYGAAEVVQSRLTKTSPSTASRRHARRHSPAASCSTTSRRTCTTAMHRWPNVGRVP